MEYINKDEINIPNLVTFQEWNTLKQYGRLTEGFRGFLPEELDKIVVFYDDNMIFMDYLERKRVENVIPAFVLVPRFFWDLHKDTIPTDYLPNLKVQERLSVQQGWNREVRFRREANYLNEKYLFDCSMTPRPEQKPALDFLANLAKETGQIQGILQASPGTGKTVMSIKTLQGLRAKGLIVVPNEVLQDQWLDAIQEFTDLTLDDIAVIQGSDILKIEKVLDGKDIAIVKIQSLYSQIKNNSIVDLMSLYKWIDLVIYDEAHTSSGATGYAKTSSIFMTGNYLGLTATPYRVDLNYYMLRTSIGEVIHKIEFSNEIPDVEIHNVWTEFYPKEISKLKSMLHEYTMFLGVFNALMKTKKNYFEYLADVVAWNHSQGHNIVVLFSTIALMEKLQNELMERHPNVMDGVLLLKGRTKQDAMDLVKEERKLIMQDYKQFRVDMDVMVKQKELKRKEAVIKIKERRAEIDTEIEFMKEHALDLYKKKVTASEIIISNYNLLSAGFDKSTLSNIIFGAAPRIGKISVIQSIGRITRKSPGKKKPLVQYFIPGTFIDFQSSVGIILNRNIKVQYPDANFKYIGFQ